MGQMNRNLTYLTEVDGITPWERLRVIRNFLDDRRMALYNCEAEMEKIQEKETFSKEIEKKIYLLSKKMFLQNYNDCKREVEFLEKLEKIFMEMAEKERIPGKTDEEMYEINFLNETVEQLKFDVQSEVSTSGHISITTMKRILRNPVAMKEVVKMGYLQENALELLQDVKQPLSIEYHEKLSSN